MMAKQRARYKVTNWSAYNKSLVKRGSITLWLCEDRLRQWRNDERTGRRGRPKHYSDGLVELCLMVKQLYGLSYRATEGFVKSLLAQLKFEVELPSYSQLSRRAAELSVKLKRVFRRHKGPVDIAVDSTGLKVYGEGEWKVRAHGPGKRRTWRKLHLAVDPLDHEVMACALTDNGQSDDQVFPTLFEQVDERVERCFGDGAYDRKRCYTSCHDKQTELITPPKRGGKVQTGDRPDLFIRDHAIRRIGALTKLQGDEELARKQWKVERDYHCRSLSETAMFRFKTLFGDRMTARKMETQTTEAMIKVNLMNQITAIGMPISDVTYSIN